MLVIIPNSLEKKSALVPSIINPDFLASFLRAIIRVLIFNYNALKIGHSVGSSQFLQKIILLIIVSRILLMVM